MATPMDMSLDDIIKAKKSKNEGNNSNNIKRNKLSGGIIKRNRIERKTILNRRKQNYSSRTGGSADNPIWEHDLFEENNRPKRRERRKFGNSGEETEKQTGVKVIVDNLMYTIGEKELLDLLSGAAPIQKVSIHYDRSGRSEGRADVFYNSKEDALASIKRFDGLHVEGKPIRLTLAPTTISKNSGNLIISTRARSNLRGRKF